jgi:hypothetical protein
LLTHLHVPLYLRVRLHSQLVGVVVKTFGEAYPELVKHQEKIHSVIAEEEASFSRTLGKGIERFKKLAAAAQVGHLEVIMCCQFLFAGLRGSCSGFAAVHCTLFDRGPVGSWGWVVD